MAFPLAALFPIMTAITKSPYFLEKIIAFWFKCMKWVALGRLYMVGAMSDTQTSMGTGHML